MENFLTELVAYLFQNNSDILFRFLAKKDIALIDDIKQVTIYTQKRYASTDGEGTSIPDIVIHLNNGTGEQVLFVESKVGSFEHQGQLHEYAKILTAEHPDAQKKVLIYITEYFDPKDEGKILRDLPGQVIFQQIRWRDFYKFLLTYSNKKDFLINETMKFMEENNMASKENFAPADLLTMSNLLETLNLLDETLSDDVQSKFKEIFGSVKSRFNRDYGKFFLYPEGGTVWCELGYTFNQGSKTFPTIGISLWATTKGRFKSDQALIDALKEIAQTGPWAELKELSSSNTMAVGRQAPLVEFLSQERQVQKVKDFFLELLSQLDEIKSRYPQLAWQSLNSVGNVTVKLTLE